MRILFLIDNLRPGGAQKALLTLARACRSAGIEPAVWCLGGSSEIEKQFTDEGIPVLGKPPGVLATLWEPVALLAYLIRNRDLRTIQTFLFHSDIAGRVLGRLAGLFRKKRLTIITAVRASNVRNRIWQFWAHRLTAPLTDVFTAVSQRTLEFASEREGLRRERAIMIPNGIEIPLAPDRTAARRSLGLSEDDFVLLSLGRLHRQKGQEYLLRAMPEILRERPGALLLIAGYGPLREHLESVARELGISARVRFLGYRSDVQELLAACDIFVLPSLWEGMSNAILEAMASERPIIATTVDGALEQVEDSISGLLVPPHDPKALAEAILTLARDPARAVEMARAGRVRCEKDFSLAQMTEGYLQLYRRLGS